jgi:uncharacterized membrane protein
MSETGAAAAPSRRINWIMWALVASLALNLLFVGAGVARFLVREPPERIVGLSQVQLIPRKFFSELEGPRRAELMGVFREMGPTFRDGRRAAREEIAALASALEAEPYDEARVKATVDSFSTRSGNLVAAGGETALKFITMLTPEERKLLAQHIRQRAERGRGRGEKRGQ